jgi:hypothetical protein
MVIVYPLQWKRQNMRKFKSSGDERRPPHTKFMKLKPLKESM